MPKKQTEIFEVPAPSAPSAVDIQGAPPLKRKMPEKKPVKKKNPLSADEKKILIQRLKDGRERKRLEREGGIEKPAEIESKGESPSAPSVPSPPMPPAPSVPIADNEKQNLKLEIDELKKTIKETKEKEELNELKNELKELRKLMLESNKKKSESNNKTEIQDVKKTPPQISVPPPPKNSVFIKHEIPPPKRVLKKKFN
jgi:hypothetical protein